MAAEQRDVLELGQVDLLPFVEAARVRPDEKAGLAQHGIRAAAHVLDPAFDEPRLVRRVLEERRADVEDERPRSVEPDLLAELLARARRRAAEPLVVALRAGDDDPIGRHPVELDRFLLLRVVPDGDEIRDGAQQRLARQMVPAADAEHRAQTERARAQVVIELRRTEIDERRDQARRRASARGRSPRARGCAARPARTAAGPTPARGVRRVAFRPGQRRQPPDGCRRPLLRPPAQPGRRVVARIEEAQVVDAEAQLAAEVGPRARLRGPASTRR